ncbi:MAG: hypothetical protein LiPW15_773 [Parcubacteria group bacterium LiPW_15]|nr:MAG: hypothetical protein LiPW15_773 [Parcubacteria group bacterium LiPW_15]
MDKSELILKKEKRELLASLGINLPESEAEEVADKLLEHFDKIIIETLLLNLSLEDAEGLSESTNSDKLEAAVEELAAKTPGLLEKIETALSNEFEVIKAAYAK